VIIPLPPEKMRAIYVNGFAFPSIDPGVLQSTLPYLSFLSLFSYQVRPDGSLKPIDDTRAVQTARSAGVAPLMTITNIEEGDGFDSELARSLLSDRQTQEVLLNNIVAVLQEKGYAGLVVDFEYIYPEDRQNYSNFISRTVSKLRPLGYQTAVAVAPKLSAGQTGLLYEAHDYPSLGALADFIILMTY
jgi:spore germination protein